ncbi:hypothetical protein DSO57_1022891 [Entomophthora muscae]|uniref:Uncharacterized protein n=1 Tax=Entomophthora muscae TaxID=34485 RepID=A0ACC2T346_9FUNG|nr:hypothetical protein DSO57_1022891 [Entomophthora muscae]
MFMAQEQGHQPNPPSPRTFQRYCNCLYNPCCYNCSEVGHISKDCTAPCSICKEPSHSNFICEFNPINNDRKPQGWMMAEQNYEAKHVLSSSATPQPLNKKSNLEYIVDPDGPSFPFTLICRKLTPPPMKRTDCEDAPSPSTFPPRPCDPDPPRKPPSSPLSPCVYVRNSKWNPCHPNRFVSLEIEDDFENEDHYLCLPDLDKYLSFKDNPRYNIVTVESVPESPHSEGKFPNLPSVTPSLEASPAGAAAWEHRATSQESKDEGPTAFGDHHCSHPGPLGPALVSWVNSPGLGPIRSHTPQDARAQRALYNPHDLAQPINSFSATCSSMNMASSEFSNLDKPIMPNNAMEVDSANILINDCNLAGPITPNNAMEVDSPNALINKCNLNEPIKPLNAMETDTPNLLSNYCNSDGPIRSGAAGAKFNCSDQAGCPIHGQPIKPCNTKSSNTSQSDLTLLVQI